MTAGLPERIPLRSSDHATLGWQRFTAYSFAGEYDQVPITVAEVQQVALGYPMAFRGSAPDREVVAILGLQPRQNLYVDLDGRWQSRYVPACFRAYPFSLGEVQGDGSALWVRSVEMVPMERPGVTPFFTDQGLHPLVQETRKFLLQFEQGRASLQKTVAAIDQAGLLCPWNAAAAVEPANSSKDAAVLYRIDEARLQALPDEALLALRHAGALPVIYAQLVSIGHLARLQQWARLLEQKRRRLPSSAAGSVSVSRQESLDDFLSAVVQAQEKS